MSEFNITYHPHTALKSQIFADFIVEYSVPSEPPPNKWIVHVDRASSQNGVGVRVSLTGPRGEILNYALHFTFKNTNNVAEYEAMIAGLKIAGEVGAREVYLRSDSQLAVRQVNNDIRVIDGKLAHYCQLLQEMKQPFDKVDITHITRNHNCQADALSKLGAAGNLDKDKLVIVLEIPEPSVKGRTLEVFPVEAEERTWYTPIWDFLTTGVLPEDKLEARRIKRIEPMYAIYANQLYKKGYSRPWQKCVREEKASALLNETHTGLCGSHQGAKTLAKRILRAGFYWPTMKKDTTSLVRKCRNCQYNSKLSRIPPYDRTSITGAWPFNL